MSVLLKINNNYKKICDLFLELDDFCKTYDAESNQAQIEKDLPRTVYLSRTYDVDAMKQKWRQPDTDHSFTQGNIEGRNIGEIFAKTTTLNNQKLIEKDLMLTYFQSLKSCCFAFIDTNGNDCGFNLTFCTQAPEFFIITLTTHTRKKPDEREMLLYLSTDNDSYPSLPTLNPKAFKEGKLITHAELKEELLALPSLPKEVSYLLHDIFKADGTINVDNASRYASKESLQVDSNNSDLIFAYEYAAKNDLRLYHFFCVEALNNLLKSHSNTNQELIQKTAASLREIDLALDPVPHRAPKMEQTAVPQLNKIQLEMLTYINQPSNEPFQNALKTMQAKHDDISRLFWQRRQLSLILNTSLSLLAIATSFTHAPILIAAMAVASMLSWTILVCKELLFENSKLKHHFLIGSTTLSKNGNSFFSQANHSFQDFQNAMEDTWTMKA